MFRVAGSERLRITAAGRVGIGTNNPDSLLHLYSSSSMMKLEDSDGTNEWSRLAQIGSNLKLQLRNGSNNGTFAIQGYGGGTPTDFVNVDSDGKVGIGTDNPAALLHLQGTGGNTSGLRIQNGGGNIVNLNLNTNNNGSAFSINYSGTGGSDIQITNSGNVVLAPSGNAFVGVGTYTATSRLHVVGDALITGIVTVTTPSASKGARNISISTEAPSGGSDGDLWFTYIA